MPVNHCLECHAKLDSELNEGLCPRCMLRLGLASQLDPAAIREAGERQLIAPPLFPFEFGGFRVLRLLGRGGMGAVYEAEEMRTGRRVALKVLGQTLDSGETRQRFLREGRLAASVNHPHCVYVFGTEEIEGVPVIAMELVPGGTLQERVRRVGPLPVSEAVDRILEVLAGLEAAHAVGILHRDVKPSNCFLEADGSVKVGDFGLSISTLARTDASLTTTGGVLGTPAFAAPEQLRGDVLDMRADLYSVGATLFFLLTGQPPFSGENLVGILASVLEKPAPSPRRMRPEIPEGLERVILKCLSKPADGRYGDYSELRRALQPFASGAPLPATLSRRVLAWVVDAVLGAAPFYLMTLLGMGSYLQKWRLPMMGLWWAYFAVAEWRWGATLGKRLFGLRVERSRGGTLGFGQALARVAVFDLNNFFLTAALSAYGETSLLAGLAFLGFIYKPLLAISARARNGYATLVDLVTGTRVVLVPKEAAPAPLILQEIPPVPEAHAELCGPYHLHRSLENGDGSVLWSGFDMRLMRRVWVRKYSGEPPSVNDSLRGVSRPGRLRWLDGQRGEVAWDAYEAVPGQPLMELLKKPNPWSVVRYWVADLAEELAAAQADGTLPQVLGLDRIWITETGRAKLLDFPAPGVRDAEAGMEPAVFLNRVAISILEGRLATREEAQEKVPVAVLPLSVRETILRLRDCVDLPGLVADFKRASAKPGRVLRWQRAALFVGCLLPALFFMSIGPLAEGEGSDESTRNTTELPSLVGALSLHNDLQYGTLSTVQGHRPNLESLEVYIAERFGPIIRAESWEDDAILALVGPDKKQAQEILQRHPNPTPEEVSRAKVDLGELLNEAGELPWEDASQKVQTWGFWMDVALIYFGATIGASIAAALLFRGGVVLRGLGLAVVTQDGSMAGAWRMVLRSTLAWMWWVPTYWALTRHTVWGYGLGGAIALMALSVVFVRVARGQRALSDQISGTWIVPR